MMQELIIFGASGELGTIVSNSFIKGKYNKVYLIVSRTINIKPSKKVILINSGDLTNELGVIEVFKRIRPSKKKLVFLFSAVGGYVGGNLIWDESISNLHMMLNKNLITNFLILKHFALLVQKCLGGAAVFTSAYTSLSPNENNSVYGLSKSALNYLIKVASVEGKSINMSVNGIAPYIINTETNNSWFSGDKNEIINPKEIAEFVENIFNNSNIINGNIISMPFRLKNLK